MRVSSFGEFGVRTLCRTACARPAEGHKFIRVMWRDSQWGEPMKVRALLLRFQSVYEAGRGRKETQGEYFVVSMAFLFSPQAMRGFASPKQFGRISLRSQVGEVAL